MKSREELLREAAEHPERLVEYISALQEQLGQTGQELTAAQRDLSSSSSIWQRPKRRSTRPRRNFGRRRSSWPKPRRSSPN